VEAIVEPRPPSAAKQGRVGSSQGKDSMPVRIALLLLEHNVVISDE